MGIYMAKAMGLEKEANSKPFVVLTYKDLKDINSAYHKLIYVLIEAGVLVLVVQETDILNQTLHF